MADVPQILRIAGDQGGTIAVSCWRWALFALFHLTTVVYALVVADDLCMALMFGVSAVGCATIVVLTCVKRHRVRHRAIPMRSHRAGAASSNP